MTADIVWRKISISPKELSLARVLRCGQTFRWKNINNTWAFTISDRIILLKQDETHIHYSWLMAKNQERKPVDLERETLSFINDYFNLSTNLTKLYEHWTEQDSKYKRANKISPFDAFTGIRILRQDPWETTISFICSSNNNVKRISKMCDSLCSEFGDFINTYDGVAYYTFPSAQKLSSSPSVETKLRDMGFGYRAKYIYRTALMLSDSTSNATLNELNTLRTKSYEESHNFLLQLTGVGPKVADCICLMALDKHDVVPVDTHVYQIAVRDYKFKGKRDLKTMNKQSYDQIRLFFKEIFGPYAGWAQSVLFTSDLVDLNNGINQTTTGNEKSILKAEIKEEITVGGSKRVIKEEVDVKIKRRK
ncbi:N-glycosylase/DNA lyase [[Candida] anglica]